MTKEVKKIIWLFLIAGFASAAGAGFFVWSKYIVLSRVFMGLGFLLHAVWFILLLKLLLTKSDKQKQVLH